MKITDVSVAREDLMEKYKMHSVADKLNIKDLHRLNKLCKIMETDPDEIARLRVMLNARKNFNAEMMEQLLGALNYLTEGNGLDEVYENYLITYRNKLKSYKSVVDSEDFINLHEKYFANTCNVKEL